MTAIVTTNEAATAHEALREQIRAIGRQIDAAIEAADVKLVIQLRDERNALEEDLATAEIAVVDEEVANLKAQMVEARKLSDALQSEYGAAKKEFDVDKAAFDSAKRKRTSHGGGYDAAFRSTEATFKKLEIDYNLKQSEARLAYSKVVNLDGAIRSKEAKANELRAAQKKRLQAIARNVAAVRSTV